MIGEYPLREINFEEIIHIYFWDTEFLFLREMGAFSWTEVGPDACVQEQRFNLAEGLHPHPDLLRVEQVTDPVWMIKANDGYLMPGSHQYPDRGF